eukprot:gene20964-23019_t
MFCPFCGEVVQVQDAKFCSKCGHDFVVQTSTQPSATNFQASPSFSQAANNILSLPKGMKSFEAFHVSKGSEWKKRVTKKEEKNENLPKYKAEVGKDSKRIVLFLCTLEDHLLSENGGIALEEYCEPAAKYPKSCDDYLSCVQNDICVSETVPTFACQNISEFECQMTDSTIQSQENDNSLPLLPASPSSNNSLPPPQPLHLEARESDTTKKQQTILTYKQKLANLREIFMGERNDSCQLVIRRRKVWFDTAQKLKRLFADGVKPFTVQFIGEAGVDAGGPTKEFFTFHVVGILMECAGPRCFIPSVVARLLNGVDSPPTLEDIPDLDVQMKLQDLINAVNEDEFQARMESFSERYMFGVTRVHVSFEDRSQLVKDVALHLCLSTCSDEIQEVRKGMEVLGVLQVLQQHFDESKEEFCVPSEGKASNIISLFKTIEYSEPNDQSSGQRDQEEDIIYNFTNFLERLEHDGSLTLPVLEIEDDGSVLETTREIMLQEVTRFCTGSRFITPAMEGKGTIRFDNTGKYGTVIANTCSIVLTFPIIEKYTGSPELFIQSFTEDMRNECGFGLV